LQVKIRGFRLEIGEVEAALRAHSGIREAAVGLAENEHGERQLTAFLVFENDPGVTVCGLRKFLAEKLPEHAIPAHFRVVPALPFTSTGKIDRQALTGDFGTDLPIGTEYAAPRNERERQLVRIWQDLLGINRIGISENFFHLGGHSLSATQVVARIRNEMGFELPLREFFDSPTIAELCPKLQNATVIQSALFSRRKREGPVKLSFAQERLWFLDQLEPNSPAYHIPDAYIINGPIDVSILERSLRAVADRHELLRTTLQVKDGNPVQVIGPSSNLTVQSIDRASASETEQETEIVRQIKENSATVFDLATGPLLQLKVVRLAPERYLLLVNMHHVVSDDWSLGVFYRELSQFYSAFLNHATAGLEPLPIQYADYALCQRRWMEEGELERQLVYWRNQLADAPTLELPLDFPRPPRQTFIGTRIPFQISPELTARLKAFDRAENVTHFMTLLAAFQVLLARYSGQDDIVVGVPIANRRHVEVEGLFGFFVNMLVLRGDLSGRPSFREIVRRVRTAALEAYQNQDLPFEKLVEDINPDRDLSRPPLFQVMFAIHDVPTHPLTLPNAVVTRRVHAVHATHFDLEFYLSTAADPWSGFIGFNTDLLAPATIERMIGHYLTLLDSLLQAPEAAVFAASMLSDGEKDQLDQWSGTSADYGNPQCVHQLFEEQVRRSPDAIAVQFDGRTLTYRELNLRANALAFELLVLGTNRETRIGVCVERSLEMVVALIAVLKAGGTYVPIDIHFPPERVALILKDSGAEILILHQSLRGLCHGFTGKVLTLDQVREPNGATGPDVSVSGADAAYVYYTSGSTGRPKGVIIEHHSVVNFL
ncbi:MAG TPA: condensation domain-containing protein, partial [Chthoniobacterales bacterium]|nr:condensation domain-containing protein [Chthoniobacterales bacterium]